MEYTNTFSLRFDSGVATITLNRPEKRNAISLALVDELLAALDEIEQSPAQVVILTGAGKAFCAGMDLDELKACWEDARGKRARLIAHGAASSVAFTIFLCPRSPQ